MSAAADLPDAVIPAAASLPRPELRLQQVIVTALAGLAVCGAASLARGMGANAALIGLAGALLAVALRLVRRGRFGQGLTLLLTTLTVMAASLAWLNRGAHGEAILAFPAILIFAGMLGTRRLLLTLLAAMVLAIGALVTADVHGWRNGAPVPEDYGTIVNLVVILVVTAYSVRLVTSDRQRAMRALELEVLRVLQSQLEIERVASHDALTGLPNRLLARDRFEQALARASRQGRRCAALYFDLDHFKALNETRGHAAGDELLRQAGARLAALVREGDTVCRLGGDEFLVLLTDADDADAVAAFATRALEGLAMPFEVHGAEVSNSASIGIALCPGDATRFGDMLKSVDIAMYQAKDAGGNTFRFFDKQMNTGVMEHCELLAGMRAGLARGEFQVHYQPQFDLGTGHLIGAEALLRWRHPTLGVVPPARFVPVAERSGFIVELGAWVVREACHQAAAWDRRFGAALRVSVNLSPVQFRRGDIEHVLLNALESCALPPERLEVELTESMLLEDSRDLRGALERLRTMGIGFAIDDFGTGYSNLAYLKRFEVGRLKIDQSFVRRLTQDLQDQAIVGAIVQMATRLGLTTIAEGVEDAATLALLRDLGCNEGQGFHWSPALSADSFAARWLAPAAVPLPA